MSDADEVKALRAKVVDLQRQAKRRLARAAIIGAILALLCACLPNEYRAACHAVANVCTP